MQQQVLKREKEKAFTGYSLSLAKVYNSQPEQHISLN
jgi:hypothetical protein